jgi:hypothetical protein
VTPYVRQWFDAFWFTQAVEVPIYVAALRRLRQRDRAAPDWLDRLPWQIAVAFAASLLTHPIVWFVIPHIPHQTYRQFIVRAEGFAWVAEALWVAGIGGFRYGRALLVSLAANAASAGLGELCRYFIGWP